ncbi:MAG: type II toxin-antitoxin system VapC family toxin [Verrucomicrobia bacterium]|nr:type II toxin-antitoxin system VapC family toxin [Verrucomicrobiota bacterium]
MLLLDTNFLIDLHSELRRKDGADGPAKRFMRANKTLPMAITPVTANEYAVGIRNEREARRFLRRFRLIAFGRDIAFLASRIDRAQIAKGLRVGENDTWQAAAALRFNLTIVTDDTDFDKVPQVKRRNYLGS